MDRRRSLTSETRQYLVIVGSSPTRLTDNNYFKTKGVAALCSMLVMVAQMLAPHIATLGKALALVAVVAAAVVFAVTCWQFVAGGLVVAAYAYATMPK